MDFLDEQSARTAIGDMLATAEEARIAVAFWGNGAAEDLGLSRKGLKLQIVCNLASGACNPQ